MDPVSQGLFGAALAQFIAKEKKLKIATLCGFIGGLTADLDVLIKSAEDSLFAIEYHRHFTHSLFFIPIGGLLTALCLWMILRFKKVSFKETAFYTIAGYATHGFLDACTSYGTRLYWPFSNERVSWNVISIIDPLFSLPLMIVVIWALLKPSRALAKTSFCYALLYLSFGFLQQMKVKSYIENIAAERNHQIERVFLNPTIFNNVLWRSIYQYNGKYYIDAARVFPFADTKFKAGEEIEVLDINTVFTELPEDSTQSLDIRRFAYFSKGFVYLYSEQENIIADARYGTLPYDSRSLWGLKIDPNNPQKHAEFMHLRNVSDDDVKKLKGMIKGNF